MHITQKGNKERKLKITKRIFGCLPSSISFRSLSRPCSSQPLLWTSKSNSYRRRYHLKDSRLSSFFSIENFQRVGSMNAVIVAQTLLDGPPSQKSNSTSMSNSFSAPFNGYRQYQGHHPTTITQITLINSIGLVLDNAR